MSEASLPADPRWVMVVHTADRPGVLTAIASVFSSRGVSLETILGSAAWGEEVSGRIVLSFRAGPRRKEMLCRIVQRLARVETVESYAYGAPEMRLIALVRMAEEEVPDFASLAVHTEPISAREGSRTVLLAGPAAAVEEAIAHLHARHTLIDVVRSVMAE